MAPLYKIMKKSYTDKKRTSIALDPDLTKRVEKVLKNSGGKLSKYAQEAIKKELENDEMKQILSSYGKLDASEQYQKIKQLEGEVEKLKQDHVTAKEIEFLGIKLDAVEIKEERRYKKLLDESKSRIQIFKEVVKLLKTAKKNPIIKKELEKM